MAIFSLPVISGPFKAVLMLEVFKKKKKKKTSQVKLYIRYHN